MNKNVKRLLALTMAFIMVFAAGIPVLANNTNNTPAQNNRLPVIQVVDGDLWVKFHVNYEKSKVAAAWNFTEASERDPGIVMDVPVDSNGNVMYKVEDWETDDELFLVVYDIEGAQPRYFRIFTNDNGILDSEELQADGTPAFPAKKLGTDANLQPIVEGEIVNVPKPYEFCIRWQYSDPNVGQDAFALPTNLWGRIFHVARGANAAVEANRTYVNDPLFNGAWEAAGTDGKICFEGDLIVGRDYYVEWNNNPNLFVEGVPVASGDPFPLTFLFHVQTGSKLVNGGSVWNIERDDKGNQTNDIEFKINMTPVELGQFLLRAMGSANQPVRNVQFDIFKIRNTDAYHYAKDQDGNYLQDGAPIYRTAPTNWNGYAGIAREDISVHPATGVVSIRCNTGTDAGKWVELRTGELLGVRAVESTFPAPGAANSGYKYNGKVYALNLWKVIDVDRYNDALKQPSIDPATVFALRDDKVVTTIPFGDLFATFRVKIFNAGRTPQKREPITGATVALYKNGNTALGQELMAGEKIIEKKTDEYGIVEFKNVPIAEVKEFFTGGLFGTTTNAGGYASVGMPYLIKQLDAGNHEGVQPYPNFISTEGYFELENGSTMTGPFGLAVTRADYGFVYDIEIENHVDFFGMAGRLAGENRYETSVEIARTQFSNGLPTKDGFKNVIIAEVNTFADALTAGVVAYEYNGPLLMVKGNELPDSIANYIRSSGATRAILVGGPNTISPSVADAIKAIPGVSIKRIAGENRFGTAVGVGNALRGMNAADNVNPAFNLGYDTKSTVFLANAYTFADALTATVPAAYYGIPVLLTHQDKLAPETIQALKDWNIEKVIIVGGENSVSSKVETEVEGLFGKGITVDRFSGANRQLTSMVLANEFFADVTRVFFANKTSFADALAAAPYAARVKAPIILVEKDAISDDVRAFLKDNNIAEGTIVGGYNQISTAVRNELANILNLRSEYGGIE